MPGNNLLDLIQRAVRQGVIVSRDNGSVEVLDAPGSHLRSYLQRAGFSDTVRAQLARPAGEWWTHVLQPGPLGSVPVGDLGLVGTEVAAAVLLEIARKQIEDRWNTDGAQRSVVGLPIRNKIEVHRTQAGFEADFRSGKMRVRHDTGEIEVTPGDWVRVWWVGLECLVRQEATDELYGMVMCHTPGHGGAPRIVQFPGGNNTLNMGPDGARIHLPGEMLYYGPLVNVVLGAALVENDSGDVEEISRMMAEKVGAAVAGLASGLTGVPADAITSQTWYKDSLTLAFKWVLDDIFGIGDDPYPGTTQVVLWEDLAQWTPPSSYKRPNNDDPKEIKRFTESLTLPVTGVDDGGDMGHYRFFFLVEHANPPG